MRRVLLLALMFALVPSMAQAQPNVLLVISDDQSVDETAALPTLRGLDNLQTFTNAYENVPLCCPTRATLFSGQYSHQHGVEENDGSTFSEASTLATWLDDAGYETGLFGKYLNEYPFGRGNYTPPGWDRFVPFSGLEPGGNYYFDYHLYDSQTDTETVYPNGVANYSTDVLAGKLNGFIQNAEDPFFAVLAPYASHSPWTAALRHRKTVVTLPPDAPSIGEDVSDKPAWVQNLPLPSMTAQRRDRANAYRTLMAVDDAIAQAKATLSAQGEWDNTVVIFLTDNGFSWGEHRVTKKLCVYQECVRTPLLIHYPRGGYAEKPALVQTIDIAPTIVDLADATAGLAQGGVSLVPYLDNGLPPARDSLLVHSGSQAASLPGFWGIVTVDGWKYAELSTGEVEFYDLNTDPYELDNLAGDPAYDAQQTALAIRLVAKKLEAGVP